MFPFLKDLKVIELASVLAGPAVGTFFAELGAEVIKIENKTTNGDVTRKWKLPQEEQDAPIAAYYYSVNMGKESRLLDLREPTDREQIYELVKEADIVISNFKTSSAIKLGMSYAQLKQHNSKLIFAQLSAFGSNSGRPAFDVVLQAETGFLYMCGESGRGPVKMPVALIDILAAHHLKEGVLLALWNREKTGEGAYVEVSLMDAAIASLANQATNWLMVNQIPQRMGNAHPNIAPYGDVFYTKDGKPVVIAAGTEGQFKALCQCFQQEQLIEDSRFSSNANRVKNRDALNTVLADYFKQHNREEILDLFHAKGVPAGSIRNIQEVFELDAAQAMIKEERLPNGQLARSVKTVAFNLSQQPTANSQQPIPNSQYKSL